MSELQTQEITSVSTVRLYRNAEGVVVMAEEVSTMPDARIVQLYDQHAEIDITYLSGFMHLTKIIEQEILKGTIYVPRVL